MEARARHAPPASSKPSPCPPRAPTVTVAPTLRPQGLSVRAPALPALPTLRLLPVCVVHYHITHHIVCVRAFAYACVWHMITNVRSVSLYVTCDIYVTCTETCRVFNDQTVPKHVSSSSSSSCTETCRVFNDPTGTSY